ncbi:MAG: hypothetical protein LUQ38_01755 [Methanotrichaceae archaeon]|nr:hypothetical protein [Methanotrichaceae archaeon]MDD1757161.1 hypothetical protein [Methanotrichaceae archaeon]
MDALNIVAIILFSGAIGGIVNAIVSDNGFIKPREEDLDNVSIVRPGFIGNILVGAISAFISWGLYGAYSGVMIYSTSNGANFSSEMGVSISAISGAILVGMGGARWLTNEVDKSLLRTAAASAAASMPSKDDSERIILATPAQAFNIAKQMYLKS